MCTHTHHLRSISYDFLTNKLTCEKYYNTPLTSHKKSFPCRVIDGAKYTERSRNTYTYTRGLWSYDDDRMAFVTGMVMLASECACARTRPHLRSSQQKSHVHDSKGVTHVLLDGDGADADERARSDMRGQSGASHRSLVMYGLAQPL